MASLKFREKQMLEEYLEMGGGWVLNFNDRTFAEFFRDFGVDIEAPQFRDGHSGSKANRMRSFWERESPTLVGEVLSELIEYAESYRPGHDASTACTAIASRLARGAESSTVSQARQQPVARPIGSRESPPAEGPVEIFFSYAHEDEHLMDQVRLQLVVRERMGEIVKWHDRMIPAGDEWRSEVDERIERAHVILLFMSPNFLASRYCFEVEGQVALRRHRDRSARVIPVILRACDWKVTPFAELQALPQDGVPFTRWPDSDQASLDIARGIMATVR